jgi:antirestriction protein ArdC
LNQNEKVKELSKRLSEGVQQTFQSGRFKQYLKAVSAFHQYSARNAVLIFLQKPSATYVAGFETWKKLGRYVRRGEKGLSIFAPVKVSEKIDKPVMDDNGKPVLDEDGNPKTEAVSEVRIRFHPAAVFDVSQTEGKPLPTLCDELQGAVPDFQKIFTAVQNISPYKIAFERMPDDEKGYCSHEAKKIAIRSGMSDAQIVKTLLHEYAHAVLHNGTEKSREQKEIEAESAAFIVSDFLGIDTSGYSFDYVSSWSYGMDPKQLSDILQNIQDSANSIISRIQEEMKTLEKAPERPPQKLPQRLSEALKKSEKQNSEKEMIPNGKVIAQ